ncbi:zinc finger CCCH domain-containing protein 3 isoform X1 [Agrilus planipennis]|uniref:Zinc finger CCCH domain-containing protein 3 isoform X1 n=1 Tax=Agrilus planipennis TaxID=224129 RepID=A0A7F5RAN7_AGRPL|nr:zinc finger CCCH domain-containing protein 3 isoform X1 [Agrilus planipennis]
MSHNNNFDRSLGTTGILPVPQSTNKFVYVNRNMVQNGFQQKNSNIPPAKILINPNFKQSVHVNPHFNKMAHSTPSTSIFVNPNVIMQKSLQYTMASIPTIYQTSTINNIKPTEITKTTSTILTQDNYKPKEEIAKKKGAVIKNTKTKLVRVASSVNCNKPNEAGSSYKVSPTKQRQKVCSRYRLVRRSFSKDQPTSDKDGFHIKRLFYAKSRFKIDKVLLDNKNYIKYLPEMKQTRKKRFYFFNNLSSENLYVKKKIILSKTQFVGINRILNRTSLNNKLNSTNGTLSQNKKIGRKLITIRGQKFKLDAHNKTLTCLTRQPMSARAVHNLKDKNSPIKNNANKRHNLTSHFKQKNISSCSSLNRMKKCNIPCPFFRKYGRCRGKEKGTCNRVHNPDQISLCPKFLQGACINDKCLLSHKVSPEKMATCKFFLEGLCTRENCQYLHVKINAKADICQKFLEGFCDKGRECDKRHQYLCPAFEKLGKCLKKKCPYPHANVVRKRKISIKVATKSSSSQKRIKKDNYKQTPKNSIKELNESTKKVEIANNLVKRYYIDSNPTSSNDIHVDDNNETKILHSDTHSNDNHTEEISAPLPKRPKLGELPSFIPFEST